MAADLFEKGRRRCLTVGDADAGVLIGLDLEGRLYAYHDGDVPDLPGVVSELLGML